MMTALSELWESVGYGARSVHQSNMFLPQEMTHSSRLQEQQEQSECEVRVDSLPLTLCCCC